MAKFKVYESPLSSKSLGTAEAPCRLADRKRGVAMSDKRTFTATIEGDRLYQRRARQVLPLLVRQAEAGSTVYYSDLAAELGLPSARILDYPLGAIGNSLKELAGHWSAEIPPIQSVVVNKKTDLPGSGIRWFLNIPDDFKAVSRARQREIIHVKLQDIFSFTKWRDVLQALDLPYVPPDFAQLNRSAAAFGGGETEAHKKLKEFVARTPSVLDLPHSTPHGLIEHPLPSGDCVDVSFSGKNFWVAAEVKAAHSLPADLVRGIYQCVKYLAVMRAVQTAESRDRSARAVLILEGKLPAKLVSLKNMLGVEVVEEVLPD